MKSLLLESSLLNTGFQGYKLSNEKLMIKHYPLPTKNTIQYHSTKFQILDFCSKLNQLYKFENYLFYFDQEKLFMFDTITHESICVYQFPTSTKNLFPPKMVIMSNYLVITTGRDFKLYLLQIIQNGIQLIGSFDIPITSKFEPTLLDAKLIENRLFALILSQKDDGDDMEITLVCSPLSTFDFQTVGTLVGQKVPFLATIQPNYLISIVHDSSIHMEATRVHSTAEPLVVPRVECPKYVWTQTNDDVTVHLTLDPQSKHQLSVRLQSDAVLVQSQIQNDVLGGKLFDKIIPHESVWTLEDTKYLTIYLSKANKRCRWSHLFQEDDGVLETLDSATLKEYTDRLEKYTAMEEGASMKELLAMTEQAENIDFSGESCGFTVYNFESGKLDMVHQNHSSGMQWLCPVYGSDSKFVLKADVDGVVFDCHGPTTRNIDNFAALGYIRASKRDASLVALSQDLEHCVILESKRHLYLYENPQGDVTAEHYVCDLWQGDGATNSLIIGYSFDSEGLWVLKEDSIVRVEWE